MPDRIIALDVGGTFVKHAVFEGGAMRPGSFGQFAINEKSPADEIINALAAYINAERAARACVSIPGPMDYPTGTSRMRHKFALLFGIPMKARLEALCPGARVAFAHDGVAYLAGVMHLGEAEGARTPCGIMLGTGLGFAFAVRGYILVNEVDTPCEPLWNARYKDGIAEDYVSGRALGSAYEARSGERLDVERIAKRARAGDATAVSVFADAGRALGDMIAERVVRLGIDRVILGGQISKSSDLIIPYARERADVCVRPTSHPDDAALYGAYALAFGEGALIRRALTGGVN